MSKYIVKTNTGSYWVARGNGTTLDKSKAYEFEWEEINTPSVSNNPNLEIIEVKSTNPRVIEHAKNLYRKHKNVTKEMVDDYLWKQCSEQYRNSWLLIAEEDLYDPELDGISGVCGGV